MECNSTQPTTSLAKLVKTKLLPLLVLALTMGQVSAQLSGTINVPSTGYATLQDAVDSLNTLGISGAVTINVTAANTQYPLAATNGIQLGSATLNASTSASKTITINGNGNIVYGYVGTRQNANTGYLGSGLIDAMFVIKGTDYVTIDNFQFRDTSTNTTATTAMESAIALFNLSGASGSMDGCQNVNITNCRFNLTNLYNTASTGYGTYAIFGAPYLYGSATQLSWSTLSDRLRLITINNNTMTEGLGFALIRGVSQDIRARRISMTNNTIFNGGGPSIVQYGVIAPTYADTVNVSNNVINQDPNHSSTYYGLWVYYCAGMDIISNAINFNKANATATTNYGMYAYGYNYSAEATNTYYRIKKNDFNHATSANVTPTTSNTFYHIYHYSYNYNTGTGVYVNATTELDSNTIIGDTIMGSGTVYGFFALNATTASRAKVFVRGNRIDNVLRTGFGGALYTLYFYNWADTAEFAFNLIRNTRWDNTVSTGATACTYYGYYGYFGVNTAQPLFHDNEWSNLGIKTPSTASNTFYCFYIASTTFNLQFYRNKIHNLYITPTAAGGGNLYGMYLASTTTNTSIYNNVIDSLRISNNGTAFATANVSGIYHVSAGDMTCWNNYIGELYSPNSNSTANVGTAITGIWSSSTANVNLYNNTIRIGQSGTPLTSNGTYFGGAGIALNTANYILRNNIVNVNGTPGATSGTFCALRRLTAGTAGVKPTNITASHNIYNVSNTNNNYIYAEGAAGTASASLVNRFQNNSSSFQGTYDASFNGACGLYKTFMQEISTFSENNLATAGSVANTTVPTGTTYAESAGLPISSPSITTDLAGTTRATNQDRGALEFAATALDATGPTISFTPVTSIFCTTAPTLSATITDLSNVNTTSGTKPRMYYKKSTENNAFAGNTSANNGWKFVEASNSSSPFTFPFDYSLLTSTVATGDVIQYFVVAQDNASTPNVSFFNVALTPAGSCPTSVALASPVTGATSASSYTVTASPAFSVLLSPTVSCRTDTINHLVMMPNAGATFPNYASAQPPIMSQTLYWDIDTVYINGVYYSSLCAGAGGSATAVNSLPATLTNRYTNYTNLGSLTSLIAGTTSSWGIGSGSNYGSTYPMAHALWIDFNRNGTFEQNELLGTSPIYQGSSSSCGSTAAFGTGAGPGSGLTSFVVPTNVSSGPTLMRAILHYSSAPIATPAGITSATTSYAYGEVEDFIINLVGAPDPALSTFSWTSNKTGATVLGTSNPLRHATVADTTQYTSAISINGCGFTVMDTVIANTLPKSLQVFNTSQCGGGVPTIKVRDSNGFSSPTINWFATATATTPLQSSTDTTYLSPITGSTTFFVSIQNPSTGCWSPRAAITATVTAADTFNARGNGIIDSIRVCSGSPVSLTITNVSNIGQAGGAFNSFAWSCSNANSGITSTLTNGTGTQTITPTSGGDYVLTATASNAGSCRNVKYLKMSVQATPFASGAAFITTNPNPACVGTPVTHNLYLANPSAAFPNYSALGSNGRATTTNYWDIDSFQLNDYVNATYCTGLGSSTAVNSLPASVSKLYNNFTNLGPIQTLLGGSTATWKIVENIDAIGPTGYNYAYAIYLDYNRNGTFELPAEQVAFLPTAVALNGTSTTCGVLPAFTGSFTIPATVVSGPTLMRVMASYNTILTSPTLNYSYGETEDYMVNLVGPADTAITKLAWRSNQTGTSVLGNDKTLVHSLIASPSYYKVSMNNGVCVDTARDTVTNSVPALSTTSISGPTSACSGESVLLSTLTTGGCIPYTYSWATTGSGSFTNVGSSANNDSIYFVPTGATGSRVVNLTVTPNVGSPVTSTITIAFNNPTPTATGTTICGTKTATISATPGVSSNIINWYSSASSFQAIQSGTSFTTPILTAEKIYWVREFSSSIDSCDPRPGFYSYTGMYTNYGIRVQVSKRLILNTLNAHLGTSGATASNPAAAKIEVGVFDVTTGTQVGTSGLKDISIVQDLTTAGTSGTPTKIDMGVVLNPGIYNIMPIQWTNITYGDYYYNGTAFLPSSTASGNFKVIGAMLSGTYYAGNYNMYFWNPVVEEGCWGAAVPDTVKYQSPPALTLSRKADSVCSGSSTTPVNITSACSNYNTYTWAPSANVAGSCASGFVFSEPTVGNYTYIVTGLQTSGLQCAALDTFKLKVKSIPTAITRNPSGTSVSVCNGTVIPMDAASGNTASTPTGTATTFDANTTMGSTPYGLFYMDQHIQYLFLASELTALGFTAGNFDSLSWNVQATNSTNFGNYTIGIGNTTATAMAGTSLTGASTVYSNSSLAVPTGLNTYAFSTPFYWNGTSNIYVDVCHDNSAYTTNATCYYTATSGNTVQAVWQDVSAGNVCSTNTASVSTRRPNTTFYQKVKNPITWSPTTRLYTNAAATAAYTGNAKDSVWATPNDTIKYFMTATIPNGCTYKDSITINVTDTLSITTQPPASSTYCIGDTIRLTAAAASTSPMNRQWRKNGTPINPASNASALTNTLVIVVTSVADSGNYSIQYTTGSPCGPKVSNNAVVKVKTPPVITTQPASMTRTCEGSASNFSVTATNLFGYQWRKNGTDITGATSNTYSITNTTPADAGIYTVAISGNSPCANVISTDDTLVVTTLAAITTQPSAFDICQGSNTTLSVTATNAASYQWLKNGSAISGATSSSYTIVNAQPSDSANYSVIVYSANAGATTCASTTSNSVVGAVRIKQAITTQPATRTNTCQNSTSTFTVVATNAATYQWKKNGTNVSVGSGGTTPTYTITNTQPSDAGIYTVEISGTSPCANITSTNDTLVVTTLAAITGQPSGFNICQGSSGTLSVTATNAASYQWLKNGSAISGATGSSYTIVNAQPSDSANYSVIVFSANAGATACASTTSNTVVGAVRIKQAITTQPASRTNTCQNSTSTFTVVATNAATYQWKKNGTNVSVGTGGTTPTYTITNTQPSDAGIYTVEISGTSPCANITSTNDTLVVTTLAAITTQPSGFNICQGSNTTLSVTATNAASYQWLKNGSAISGATGSSYTIVNAQPSDSANYSVIVFSANAGATACASTTSNTVVGAVRIKQAITTQPATRTNTCQNSTSTFTVVATNAATYQWKKNGTNVSVGTGGTTPTYTISNTQPSDAGIYTVEISGTSPCANITSTNDTLVVTTLSAITTQPSGFAICQGSTGSLSVTATNAASYQWLKNGSAISGATGSSYTIVNAQPSDSANYSVIVLSANAGATTCASVTSNVVVGSVRKAVSIVTQPNANSQICENSPYTSTVSSNFGNGFQWRKNGTNVSSGSGATTNTYTINPVALADAGTYTVLILGNSPCPNVISTGDTLSVVPLSKITTPPSAVTVCKDQSLSLSTSASNAIGYQWYLNGAAISGATSSTYTVSSAQYADSGMYSVEAISAKSCKTDTSAAVLGAVMHPITITSQLPTAAYGCVGATFTLPIGALNVTSYTWKKAGSSIGQTTNTMTKAPFTMADTGNYSVEMTGFTPCPNVTSVTTNILSTTAAVITAEPATQDACLGTTFSISTTALGAQSYQWKKNGTDITGNSSATTNTLVLPGVNAATAGTYSVIAIAYFGCTNDTSANAVVTVKNPLNITTPLAMSQTLCEGNSIGLTIGVSGSSPYNYVWKQNGSTVGTNSANFAKSNITIADAGRYIVGVTGSVACPTVYDTLDMTVNKMPVVTTAPNGTSPICVNGTLSLTAAAQNVSSIEWHKQGSGFTGVTGTTYTVPFVTTANTGDYFVILKPLAACTDVSSATKTVNISTPVTFNTTLAKAVTLCEGNTISMSTSVSGTGPYSYSWTRNGTSVGTNNAAFSKTNILVADAGKYEVAVTGSPACPTVYDSSSITINKAPVVTVQPNSNSPVCIGQTLLISASAVNSNGLEWYKQGTGLVGTGNSYTKTAVAADAGTYYAVAKPLPACTNTTSNNAVMVINEPVNVVADPQSRSLVENPPANYTMTIGITGTGPFTYQWRRNGANISGATSSSYTINGYISSVHSGNYDCIIKTSAPCSNADTTGIAVISTMKCPVINASPAPTVQICSGEPFTLEVKAGGAKSYQWFKDGQAIPGATYANYSVTSAGASNAGQYYVEAIAYTPSLCSATFSDTSRVIVKDRPMITSQPQPNVNCGATSHTMTVGAQNAQTYQWFRNGTAITVNGNGSSYTYNSVNTSGDNFRVEIGSASCPNVVSNTVLVKTINPATKATLAKQSIFDLVERCMDNNGWTYYAPTAQSDELMLAIRKNGNVVSAMPDIEITKGIRDISPINVEQRGAVLGSRMFNLDFDATILKAYDVKFYYSKEEEDAVMNRWREIRTAAGTYFSTNRTDTISFITSAQNPFTSNLWNNLAIPLSPTNSIVQSDRSYGVENNLRYVIIKSLVATKGGGAMFMDYTLKSGAGSSGIANINANGFGFNLYPIPTSDGNITVEVSSKRMKPITFTVSDMTGRTIAQFEEKHLANDSKHMFDFSSLANGNYQIKIANDQESMTGKFTIAK